MLTTQETVHVAVGDKVTWRIQRTGDCKISYTHAVGTVLAVNRTCATIQRNGPHRPAVVALNRLRKTKGAK